MIVTRQQHHTGWLDVPERHVLAKGISAFRSQDLLAYEPTKDILAYLAWKRVLGDYPAYPPQEIGDCVGFGTTHGGDALQCAEILFGKQESYAELSTEFTYAMSRQVAGILAPPGPRSDGSFGSAAARAITQYGFVARDQPYSGDRAGDWGWHGPPKEMIAKARPIGSVAKIMDWPSLVSSIANAHPVVVCSDQGFEDRNGYVAARDSEGFCAPGGTWPHCMLFWGLRFGRRPGALCCQSWGSKTPSGPLVLDQPPFSFWVDKQVVIRMLSQGDSWALRDAPEYRRRDLPRDLRRVA